MKYLLFLLLFSISFFTFSQNNKNHRVKKSPSINYNLDADDIYQGKTAYTTNTNDSAKYFNKYNKTNLHNNKKHKECKNYRRNEFIGQLLEEFIYIGVMVLIDLAYNF